MIFNFILETAKKNTNKEVFLIRRKIRTEKVFYQELPILIAKLQKYLGNNQISEQDKILIWGLNCPEYSTLLLGCFSLNRIAVPIDFRTAQETIEKIIAKTNTKAAFISKYFKSDFVKEKGIKIFHIEDLFIDIQNIALDNTEKLIENIKQQNSNPQQICEIVFTSGTTGTPKGVIIKQQNILSNLDALVKTLNNVNTSTTVSVLPLSHMFEQIIGLLVPLHFGAKIIYLTRVNSYQMIQAFKHYKPTHLIFVPQLLKIIWGKIEERALEKNALDKLHKLLAFGAFIPFWIRKLIFSEIHNLFGGNISYIASGGAPLEPKIAQNFINSGIRVIEGYGATEITAVATINDIKNPVPGSVGKPLSNTLISINENKEIIIDSESVSEGYFNDPQNTKSVFTKNGYKTGDVGEFDSRGNLYIKGRDAFKIVLPSGEKVFAEDLESKILRNPQIKEACVVGIKTEGGDKIHVYVILRKSETDIKVLGSLIKEINKDLESKQQITGFAFWPHEDFPRTSTLKIDRKRVYIFANSNNEDRGNYLNDSIQKSQYHFKYQDVLDVLSAITKIPKENIKDKDVLAMDLKMDSLTRTELVAKVEEELGIALNESEINQYTTVDDLKKMTQKRISNSTKIDIPIWMFTKWGYILHKTFLKLIVIPLHSLIVKIEYGKLPKIEQGSIIIVNHPGVADILCAIRILNKLHLNKFIVNAWDNIWQKKGFLSMIIEAAICGIPLYKEGSGFIKIMQLNSDLMDNGYNLLIAPQGTMQRTDQEDPFLEGIGYIVKELKRPVYILKVKGYRDLWPAKAGEWAKWTLGDFLPKKRGKVFVTGFWVAGLNKQISNTELTKKLEDIYKAL